MPSSTVVYEYPAGSVLCTAHPSAESSSSTRIVLITGANRGIGLAIAEAALARVARKVYAGARSPSSIGTAGLVPVKLDVTSDQDVAAAARICSDVTLVVNNAGVARPGGLLNPEASDSALEAGASEVLADERARTVKRGLTAEPPIYL